MKINITGKVYRTGYRYHIKQLASQFDITGFVIYCPDRSVEIQANGSENNLKEFLRHCCIGNNESVVEEISISNIPPVKYHSFEVVDEEISDKSE